MCPRSPRRSKGICSIGPEDPWDILWARMCILCGTDLSSLPYVRTSVGNVRVRASYNGGLVVAPRLAFRHTEECFGALVAGGARPYPGVRHMQSSAGLISAEGAEWWGISQAALSIAIAKARLPVRILDTRYNVPCHLLEDLDPGARQVIHAHYHWLFFNGLEDDPTFGGRLIVEGATAEWLRQQLSEIALQATPEPSS